MRRPALATSLYLGLAVGAALAPGCGDNLEPFTVEALGVPPLVSYALTFTPQAGPVVWGQDGDGVDHFLVAEAGGWAERWPAAAAALGAAACRSLTTFGRDDDGAPLALGCGPDRTGLYRVDDAGLTQIGPDLPTASPFLPLRDDAGGAPGGAYYVADEFAPDLWRLGPGALNWARVARSAPTSWALRVGPDGMLYEITGAGIRRVDRQGLAEVVWTCPLAVDRCPTALVGFAGGAGAEVELFVSDGLAVWEIRADGSRPPRVMFVGPGPDVGQLHAVSREHVLYLTGPAGLDAFQLDPGPDATGADAAGASTVAPTHLADFEAVLLRLGPDGALYARDADGGLFVVRAR